MQSVGRMTVQERDSYRRGRECLDGGDPEASLHEFRRLLRTRPRFADVHYLMGLAHERQGDLTEARRNLERALEINPTYLEATLALLSIYEREGEFDRSQALAEQTAQVTRHDSGRLDSTTRGKLANMQAALGDALREAGELREAVAAYRRALERCPEFHDIRHRLGISLREVGLPHQAIDELQRVLSANPSYAESGVQLGLTYYSLGRTDEAVAEWEALLERSPGLKSAAMYLRMVRRPGSSGSLAARKR